MMGRDEKDQGQFFYAFDLEDHIPKDHLLRSIDHFLDLSGLHDHLALDILQEPARAFS